MSNSYSTYNYIPVPPRAWTRVQNKCTFINDSSYNYAYIPLINQTVTTAEAILKEKIQYKGNILKYKKNSSQITKSQKYSQISKGLWCNRTKVFATQSETYTNPNTTGLARVNYTNVPFPNQIVGYPNNISGPFQYGIANPFNCSTTDIQTGGNLLCGTYAKPCTGEVTQTTTQQQCNPSYCSNVPGPVIDLCWNPKLQTFFPKQRYVMNNSGNKWPQNYKGFQSAVKPVAPYLLYGTANNDYVTLNWSYYNNVCIPISSFNIYQNGSLINVVSYQITSAIINNLNGSTSYTYYVTAVSDKIESAASNSIIVTTLSS